MQALEKLLKRENGDTIKIIVTFYVEDFNGKIEWDFYLLRRPKGKKKWQSVHVESWEFRQYGPEMKRQHLRDAYLREVTKDEVNAAYMEAWQTLKPPII